MLDGLNVLDLREDDGSEENYKQYIYFLFFRKVYDFVARFLTTGMRFYLNQRVSDAACFCGALTTSL